ncbi:MAG: response regulator transcription factor [Lentisphaeria bacterium]|nr:response regulator transcription factor [Lentisphaeria bacterium]
MPKENILVVDDEKDIRDLVSFNLGKNGYRTTCVGSGEDALARARADVPDLIILDLMLPGVDGFDVCRRLKIDAATARIPVLMLTARGEDVDVVAGLELGADDYVTKPFSPRVLLARVRALLRKTAPPTADEAELLRRGEIVIDTRRHQVRVNDDVVDMTHTEFKTLHFLAKRPGWVFSRNQIIKAVHGESYPVTERSVDVQIVGLRKKLGACGERIETVRGMGYRFREAG